MPEEILTLRCNTCKDKKPLDDFNRCISAPFGRQRCCRICQNKKIAEWQKSPEGQSIRKQYLKRPYVQESLRQSFAKYEHSVHGRKSRALKEHRRRHNPKHRMRILARNAIRYAVSKGRIQRPTICECGKEGPTQSHHHNGYEPEHWFDVQWLCQKCHRAADLAMLSSVANTLA